MRSSSVLQDAQDLLVDEPLVDGVRAHRAQRGLAHGAARAAVVPRRSLRPGRHPGADGAEIERGGAAVGVERQLRDARKPLRHRATGHGRGVSGEDVGARAQSARACARRVLADRAHALRAMIEIGLGPDALGRIGIVPGADHDRARIDRQRVEARHEVARAAVVGGDHRCAEQHRLGDRKTEALRAVQRDVAVQLADQRVLVLRRQLRVDHGHAAMPRGGGEHGGVFVGTRVAAPRIFSTSPTPSSSANARANASISPSGFLRAATLA